MNQWLVAALGLGAATALGASGSIVSSLDDDPGTAARWHQRLAPAVKTEFGGQSYGEAARAHYDRVRNTDSLSARDLERAAHWWWERLPSPGNRGYGDFSGNADPFNQEWTWMQQETPAAAAAAKAFDDYYTELVRWAYVSGRRPTGSDLTRVFDRLIALADALDHDRNTEAAVDTGGSFVDAGEIAGGFVDDVINPPLRAVAWGARKVTGIGVDAANAAIDAAEAAVTSLVKGVGVTALVTLGAVTVAGVVLWKYGGGNEIAKEAVKA